jgi:hypothetical protein
LNGTSRVTPRYANQPKGLGIKLLELTEANRSFVRTWIARAGSCND